MGKVREWEQARKKLKQVYLAKDIIRCEARLAGCFTDTYLSFAHRYKRADPRTRHTFQQTILACIPCHQRMEPNKELTERLFTILRPVLQ